MLFKGYQEILDTQNPTESDIERCKELMKDYENEIEDYEDVLKRLERAHNALDEIKESFKTCGRSDKNLRDDRLEWKGNTYSTFKAKMGMLVSENDTYYENSIDAIQDAINTKIGQIQSKRNGNNNIFTKLANWLDSIGRGIENHFN